MTDRRMLKDVGERFITREITKSLSPSDLLLDGFGHDAAFLDMEVESDEVLVVNTDRSGMNIAYKLGLADGGCVGDLGVSHAISDIVAAGAIPKAVTVALLLPPNTEVGFVLEVMKGVEISAQKYGAILTGGDTKQSPKFAMVVTAIGIAKKSRRLGRSKAKPGDHLVVTGEMGTMLLGTVVHKRRLGVSASISAILDDALVSQNPPFALGRRIADAKVANACTDISDGLAGAVYNLCLASGTGALLDEKLIPINKELMPLAESMGATPMQLALAGGDWQYLYSVPEDKLDALYETAANTGSNVSSVGRVIEEPLVAIKTVDGELRHLLRVEHDSFKDNLKGTNYFDLIGSAVPYFGDLLNHAETISTKILNE